MYQYSTIISNQSITRLMIEVNEILTNVPRSKLLNLFADKSERIAVIVFEYDDPTNLSDLQDTIIEIKENLSAR